MNVERPMARRVAVASDQPAVAGPLAGSTRPRVAAVATTDATVVVVVALWTMGLVYAAFMIFLGWDRFDKFLTHAQDMGNMAQAAWNTAHGHLFQFNNLRIKMNIEASGTTTRLSFHVEPIFLLLAIPYRFFSTPVTLIAIQALVVASGVFPVAWLARRHLRLPLAQVVFPLAYLLTPALEAANLYEFHPVTLSAAFLLWAFYFADGARYVLFVVFGLLAMSTKEEIGLVVAIMGLWIWWKHRERTFGLTTAILAAGWSVFCVLVIMRHFSHGHSSPYCARFNPYLINGHTADPQSAIKTCTGVAKILVQHPDQLLSILIIPQKLGFLHRLLMPTGYLSLLSLPALAISLPSYVVILFSNDVHMYSGLGHYPAELVPILIASAILGTAWLANRVGPRLRIPPAATITVACLWLLVASVANQRVNGFTPLYEGFALPQETYHVQVGHRILSLIPPGASVSAGDFLNDYVSDRRNVYLFPDDFNDAEYVVADASRDNFPYKPIDERNIINGMLTSNRYGRWGIVAAQDGYVLLKRQGDGPRLPTTLPPSFYTFVQPASPPTIAHPMAVNFGPLQLLGYNIERREQVNLRQPDVLLTTYWKLTAPVTQPITPVVYLTNGAGAIDNFYSDHPALDWLPITKWPVGKAMVVTTVQMTVFTNENGKVDIDLGVYRPETCSYYPAGSCDLLQDAHPLKPGAAPPEPTFRYWPDVRWTPGYVPLEVVGTPATILKLAQVNAQW